MSVLEVTLVKSWAGRPERQRRTLAGLGLGKINDRKVLPDTPAILGMVRKVGHLVEVRRLEGTFVSRRSGPAGSSPGGQPKGATT